MALKAASYLVAAIYSVIALSEYLITLSVIPPTLTHSPLS